MLDWLRLSTRHNHFNTNQAVRWRAEARDHASFIQSVLICVESADSDRTLVSAGRLISTLAEVQMIPNGGWVVNGFIRGAHDPHICFQRSESCFLVAMNS